ncbi:MAG: MFS transporter [Candidatus Binataceae bacterium]
MGEIAAAIAKWTGEVRVTGRTSGPKPIADFDDRQLEGGGARDRRQRRLLVGSLFVSMFFIMAANDTFGIFLTPLVKEFGWSRAHVSLLFTGESLALGVSAIAIGWLLDRIDARWLFSAGAIVSGLCYVLASRVHSFLPMFIIFLVIGVGLAATTFLPVSVVVSNWFDDNRGMAMGIAMSGEMFGAMILAVAVNYAIAYGGWRFGFAAIAIPMFLIAAPLTFAVVRTHPPGQRARSREDLDSIPGLEMREAIWTRSFWVIALAYLCWGYSFGAPFTQFVAYLIGLGYRPDTAALAFSIMMGCAVLGEWGFGGAADRLGARETVAIVFTITAIIQVILLGAANLAMLAAFVIVNGLVIETAQVILPMVLADSLGLKRFGSLAGLMWFPLCVGVALGPWVTGRIFDFTGSYSHGFLLSAAVALLGGLAALAARPREYKTAELSGALSI